MPIACVALAGLLALSPAPPDSSVADLPAATDQAEDPASTAVRLRELDTRMSVTVTINGAGPFRFIVDSGATRTVISRQLAQLLALPPAGSVPLHSVGGESEVPAVRIDALTLGGLPARPIVAPALDAADLGAAGILGIDALAGRKVVIDLVRHSMTVEPADRHRVAAASNEIVVVARSRTGQLVLADADAAGQKIWAIVDTGSMVTIGNGVLQAKLVRRKRAVPQPLTITDVTGRRIVASYAPISAIRIGGWEVDHSVIAFSDAHAFDRFGLSARPAMLFGMDIMQAFARVSIDFQRRTVRLTRRSGAGDGMGLLVSPG